MSSDIAVVSVTTRNYLYRARVLFDSVAKHLPGARRILCCADSLEGLIDPSAEAFEIVEASSLRLTRYSQLALALNPTALCCALKPHAVGAALDNPEVQRVIYIDTDMGLYRRPDELIDALQDAGMVLTPHHLSPLPPGAIPNEQGLVTFGTFNAGIFGVRRCEEAKQFLHWWSHWMLDPRHLALVSGYDQVWLNYAPVYCPSLEILRAPTYNVAFWNLAERSLRVGDAGEFLLGDNSLATFHFSNFNEEHSECLVWPEVVSNHRSTEATKALAADISRRWREAGRAECLGWGYGFARWPDGSAISSEERERAKALWDGLPRDAEPRGDTADESGAQLSRMLRPELYYNTGEWMKARARHYMSIPPWQLLRNLRGKLRAQRQRRILI